MRLVIDTNVFVSAALKQSSVPALAVKIAAQNDVLLKSAETERQLFDVLARPHFTNLIAAPTMEWLHGLLANAEAVTITEEIAACRDPTDDKFLELAVSGRADIIVSGDADLLTLNTFRNIPIITPAAFVNSRDRDS
jgi:putative PIN family toxin of toxin-antitoxin system